MNFIAIDFETANNYRSSICSLGVAIVENGHVVNTEHIFIKPTPNYYDSFNTYLHGIDNSVTKDKKTFKQQWKDIIKYFNNQIIVAHNASFDCSILRFTLDSSKLSYPDLDYHCTFRLAQESLALPRHRLNDVSKYFKIKLKHHSAESDAEAAALIALKLSDKYKVDSLEKLSTGLGFKVGKIISTTQSYRPFSKR